MYIWTREGFGQATGTNRGRPDYVRWVQQSLNKILGMRLAVDGMMGPQTRRAIRSFQQQQGLVVDGVVDPQTEAAFVKAGSGAAAGPVLATPTKTMKAPSQKKAPSEKPTKQDLEKLRSQGTEWCKSHQKACEENCIEDTAQGRVPSYDCVESCTTAGTRCLDQIEQAYKRKAISPDKRKALSPKDARTLAEYCHYLNTYCAALDYEHERKLQACDLQDLEVREGCREANKVRYQQQKKGCDKIHKRTNQLAPFGCRSLNQ
jgi:putative peptidoglycan binding protein